MTGRRLYDLYCDARAREASLHAYTDSTIRFEFKPIAWPYLHSTERRVWSAIAARMKGVRR